MTSRTPLQPAAHPHRPARFTLNLTWAPDEQSIYYSHFYKADLNSNVPAYKYAVEEASLEGKSKMLVKDAQWP